LQFFPATAETAALDLRDGKTDNAGLGAGKRLEFRL